MRNVNIITAIISLLMLFPASLLAQSLSPLNSHLQKVRIGLVDEFVDRFNGSTIHPDILTTNKDSKKKNLMMLLDLEQFSSKDDSLFKEASKMMDIVTRDSIRINFSDTTWTAVAHCKGTLEGQSIKFDLFLTVQHRKQNMYKWVIAKADGDVFSIVAPNHDERIMLNPDSHETNFISLRRATNEQPHNIERFLSKGFNYDATSVFCYLVYNQKLKIDYVDDLEFIFTQIPGYMFHVKYFERENSNSGWLISNFYKYSSLEKDLFLEDLYHQDVIFSTAGESIGIKKDAIETGSVNFENNINHKEMFIKRRAEKLSQLLDNIRFMQTKDSLLSYSLYKKKTVALFADSSKVYIQSKKKSQSSVVDVSVFCEMLINRKIKFERIDSVCIPLWDEKINSLSLGTDTINLLSHVLPFKIAKGEIVTEKSKLIRRLFAYKEETENGLEWIPILGDVFVKVK